MASTQELTSKRQRLNDLEFLLVSLQGRLERNQQELATDQKLLATIDDTIPKIQRALARRTAEGDTAGAAQAQRDLDESIRDRAQLAGNIDQLQARITSGQEAIAGAQQDIRSVQTEIRALEAQGPGTVSAGDTTSAAQQANAQGADTQSPALPEQSAAADGTITDRAATTVPSNAEPNVSAVPTERAAPEKLTPATVGANTGNPPSPVPVALGNQSPAAARQQGGANLDTPDENTNLVSYIYRAYEVTSSFRQGKFTQELKGAQIFFPIAPQSSSQQTPDAARTAPDQSAAETARLRRQAGARPQGTVAQSAATAGVPISSPAAPGLLEQEGFGDPTVPPVYPSGGRSPSTQTTLPGSSFAAEGFGDPTAEQVPATAPLTTTPVAPQIATAPATGTRADSQVTQGTSGDVSVQDQLRLARNNKTQYERALADVEARIQRGEGNALANRQMRSLYADNLRTENRIIADLEKQQQSRPAPSAPNNTVAPQQGARES